MGVFVPIVVRLENVDETNAGLKSIERTAKSINVSIPIGYSAKDLEKLKNTDIPIGFNPKQIQDSLASIPISAQKSFDQTIAATNKFALTSESVIKRSVNSEIAEQKRLTSEIIKETEKRQQIASSVVTKTDYKSTPRIDYDSAEFKANSDKFKAELQAVKGKSQELVETNKATTSSVSTLGYAFGNFVGGAALSVLTEVIDLAKQGTAAIIQYSSVIEDSEQKFSQLLGNSAAATQQLRDLRQFAISTGQNFEWVEKSAKDFDRLNKTTDETLRLIKSVGNSVASTGGDDGDKKAVSATLEEVLKTKKASLETISQLQSAGIAEKFVWEALRTETGKSNEELFQLAQNGRITSDVFISAFEKFSELHFSAGLEKESKTFSSSIKIIEDTILQSSAKAFDPYYKEVSKLAVETAKRLKDGKSFEDVGKIIAEQIGIGFGKAAVGLGTLIAEESIKGIEDYYLGTSESIFNKIGGQFFKGMFDGVKNSFTDPSPVTNSSNSTAPKVIDYSRPQDTPKTTDFNSEEYKRQLELQKDALSLNYKERFNIISQGQKVEEAKLASHLRLTSNDELIFAQQQKVEKEFYLKEEIKQQTDYFNKQISLANGYAPDIAKITKEKNQVLRGLSDELVITEYNSQKQIQETERRILEQRRITAVASIQLQTREISQSLNAKSFDLNRSINLSVGVKEQFDELKKITVENYNQITENTKAQYAVQLQNERLTAEEKTNISKQMYLDLNDLAEKNRQNILEIEDRQYQDQIQKLQQHAQRTQQVYQAQSQVYQGLQNFINPESFDMRSATSLYSAIFGELDAIDAKRTALQNRIELGKSISATSTSDAYMATIPPSVGIEIAKLEDELVGLNSNYKDLKDSISDVTRNLVFSVEEMAEGKKGIEAFDEALKQSIDSRHKLESNSLQSQIDTAKALKEYAAGHHDEKGVLEQTGNINQLNLQKKSLDLSQSAESLAAYRKSIDGLNDSIRNLQTGEAGTVLGLSRIFEGNRLEETKGQLIEIYRLKDQIAHTGENDSLLIEKAHLEDIISLRQKELDSVIATNSAQFQLAHSMEISNNQIRAGIYGHLAEAQNINQAISSGFNNTFDAISKQWTSTLDKLNEKTKGFLSFAIEPLKALQQNRLSGIFGSIVDKIFPPEMAAALKSTGNPALDEAKTQSGYLKRIADAVAPTAISNVIPRSSASGSNGSGISGFIGQAIAALSGGGGAMSGVTNNPNIYSAAGGYNGVTIGPDGIIPTLNSIGMGSNNGRGNTSGILNNLKSLLGKGGIFGEDGFGNNVGTYNTIGGAASLIGSLLGDGKLGRTVSYAGQGLSMGASIGSLFGPIGTGIGAGVGAAIGALVGLFTGGTRKQDEQVHNQGMLDALAGLNQIKSALDGRPPTMDWQTGINQSKEIQSAYFSKMGELKDSKTRNNAIADGHGRIDTLVGQIQASADAARAWQINKSNTASQFVGEFAGGVFMDSAFSSQYNNFKRRNGMLSGGWTGQDTLPSMLAQGEMVLNPNQIRSVINTVGYDPFQFAGVPNWQPKSDSPSTPKFASGVNFNSPSLSSNSNNNSNAPVNNITVIIEHNENISEARVKEIAINGVIQHYETGGRK